MLFRYGNKAQIDILPKILNRHDVQKPIVPGILCVHQEYTAMRHLIVLLLLTLTILPTAVHGEEELNAGFVQGLWYAEPTIYAGQPTRIYVALRNHTDRDLTGTVRFTDNGKRIGVSYVSALPGRLVEAWVDWTPTYGKHTINASLSEVRFHTIGESAEAAEVVSMLAEDTVFVDYDTDQDGVGNIDDLDDDNDTISDVDEGAQGTDPLVATPKKRVIDTDNDARTTEDNNDSAPGTKDTAPLAAASLKSGLEQYTNDGGTIDTLLTNVTEKVSTAKTSLDAYRAKRSDALEPYFGDRSSTSTPSLASTTETVLTNAPGALATITRSKIEKSDGNFLTAVIDGGKALVGGFYTLILYILSEILAHPALIQITLLLGIVYIVYRVSRKFGQRPI